MPLLGRPFPTFLADICLLNIMATLLLKLTGPMQSWGVNSKFDDLVVQSIILLKAVLLAYLEACLAMKEIVIFRSLELYGSA